VAFEADAQNDFTVNAGTYSVVETAVAGYTTTYDNCTDVVIPNGGSATCTITNDDQPATLIVKKVLFTDDGGTLDYEDFEFSINSGPAVAFEADAQNEFKVNAGTYSVIEVATYSAYYTTTYDNCTDVVIPNGGTATCTITNDDRALNQPSIAINSLSILLDSSRKVTTGQFTITDESRSGNLPDGFNVLMTSYGVRWETRSGKKWVPVLPVSPNGCVYTILYSDVSNAEGWSSGDPILFDENLTVGYTCTFGSALPKGVTLRGTAYAEIFGRIDRQFTYSSTISIPRK
jgi:hypothetical protein